MNVYYALTDKAFVVALEERLLRQLVADFAEGRGPSSTTRRSREGSQAVFELTNQPNGGLSTVLGWLLSEQLVRTSAAARAQAEAVLRGAPERAADPAAVRALSLAYFGGAALPPYGGAYALGPDGVRDPVLGSASFPRWPRVPVSGSTVDKLLGAVSAFRSAIAFDSEGSARRGGVQSLHLSTTIELRDP